jgi:PAS domain S-box-containing protein
LVAIAAQTAAAIHNAQMFSAAQQHAIQLAMLNSISTAISSTLDLNKLLDIIVTSVGKVIGNQKAAIFLVDETNQQLQLATSYGLSADYIAQSQQMPIEANQRSSAVATRQPLVVTDIQIDPRVEDYRSSAQVEGFRAFADMPLQNRGQSIGELTVYFTEPHQFSLAEMDLLTTFANQVAIAVANAKLYARTDQALGQRVEQLAALEEIGRDLSASLDFDQVIQLVLERALTATGADFGSISLLDTEQQLIKVMVTHGYDTAASDALKYTDWPVSRGVVGQAMRTGRAVRIDDVTADPAYIAVDPQVRSELALPIQRDQQIIGAINLESTQVAQFNAAAIDFVSQLAVQAAIALQNAQLYQQAQQRLTEMSVLYSIGKQLTSILDLRQLGQELVERMAIAIGSTNCSLEILHPESDLMEMIAEYFSPDFAHHPATLHIDRFYHLHDYPATVAAIAERRPLLVYVSDPAADSFEVNALRQFELQAMMTMPLLYGTETLGTVEWGDERADRRFSDDELRLATTLANQAAIAVKNAQLFEERARRINEFSQLYQASLALTTSVDLTDVLHRISLVAREITSADIVTLYLYNPATKQFSYGSALGDSTEWLGVNQIRPGGMTYRAIEEGQPILIGDTSLTSDINPSLSRAGIRSLICIPLISKGKPLGVLYVNSFSPGKFDSDDLQVTSALANQAAVAIENARLFTDIAEGRDKLQAILNSTHDGILMFDIATRIVTINPRLEEMWDLSRVGLEGHALIDLLEQPEFQIAAKLGFADEALQHQLQHVSAGERVDWPKETYSLPGSRSRFIERSGLPVLDAFNRLIGWMLVLRDVTEERELQQLRDDLSNMIVHDLRSPLSGILGSLQMIGDGFQDKDPASIEQQALAISVRSTQKLLNLVNSLLDISKMTAGQVIIEAVPDSLATAIHSAIERISALALEAGILIRASIPADLPPVLIDEEKITRVLINLLDNALKYSPNGSQVVILAERWPQADGTRSDFVRCTIQDSGPGIPPEFRESIFERFVQITSQPGRRRGTGLGLSFCRLAIEAHGGKIWVKPGPDGGSEFSFTLPVAQDV